MAFRSPATVADAVDFLTKISREHEDSKAPADRHGIKLVLDMPYSSEKTDDYAAPVIPGMFVRSIGLYDALRLVCDAAGMKMHIRSDGRAVYIKPDYGDEDGLLTRSFNLPFSLCGVCGRIHDCLETQPAHASQPVDWQAFFTSMGVTWPAGSCVTPIDIIGKLRVTNHLKNLMLITQILDDWIVLPQRVDIQLEMVAFKLRDIEKLTAGKGVSFESLTALRKKGKTKPVSVAHIKTKSEQDAITKSTREMTWAAEPNWGTANDSNLATQEVGMILQVLPDIRETSRLIDLDIAVQWTAFKRWTTSRTASVSRQPVFETTTFLTQATVKNGDPILLGGCATPDGEWVHYGFLTATLTNVEPATKRETEP